MSVKLLLSGKLNEKDYLAAVRESGAEADFFYCPKVDLSYDGLILCGGCDLDPRLYGEEMKGSEEVDVARDEAEAALFSAFLAAGKPIFGICRGIQMLNVLLGGSLHQHIGDGAPHRGDRNHYPVHPVRAVENSLSRRLYGEEFSVNSCHHQAIKTLGKGLVATSFYQGTVESVEHESLPILGVQWHPEKTCYENLRPDAVDGSKIVKEFISLCERVKEEGE